MVASCRPSFLTAVPDGSHWTLKIGSPKLDYDALAELHREMVPPGDNLLAVCPTYLPWAYKDPICAYALANALCKDAGERVFACELSPQAREELLEDGTAR
jgi:hypothetical protein